MPHEVTGHEMQLDPFCSHRNSRCKDPADTSARGNKREFQGSKHSLLNTHRTFFTWYGFRKTSGIPSIKMMSHSRRANNVENVEPSPWIPDDDDDDDDNQKIYLMSTYFLQE